MDLLDLVELLEMDNIDRIGYASPIKIVATGKILGFNSSTKLIDFGCGRGEALNLWGKYFNINGLGIEMNNESCNIAIQRLKENNLEKKIKVVCSEASEYKIEEGGYDIASCINASMIWGGFRPTLKKMKTAIKRNGAIIISEPYYTGRILPTELRDSEGDCHTEDELLDIIHDEGFELQFIKRANMDDCDNYRASFRGELQKVSAAHMWPHYFGSAIYAMKKF